MLSWLSWMCVWCQVWFYPVDVGVRVVGVGDKGVGQNDDQSLWCPFLLITHYCATDLCQNSSSSSIEMCTKASINQEGYSSVWGCNSPHLLLFLLPVCLTVGCTGFPELKSCQPHCNWDEWRFSVVLYNIFLYVGINKRKAQHSKKWQGNYNLSTICRWLPRCTHHCLILF